MTLPPSNQTKMGEGQPNASKGVEEQLFGKGEQETAQRMMLTWPKHRRPASCSGEEAVEDYPCKAHKIYQTRYDANQSGELASVCQDKYCKQTGSAIAICIAPKRPSAVVKPRQGPVVGCPDAAYRRPLTWPHCFAGLMAVIILSSNFGFGRFVTATLAYTQRENNRALPSQTGKLAAALLSTIFPLFWGFFVL